MFNWRVLNAGSLRLDGGGMFGVVPKTLWSKLVTPDDANRILLHTNCLLLEQGDLIVLVETGFGGKWSDTVISDCPSDPSLTERVVVDYDEI